jgi:hypothetical protein
VCAAEGGDAGLLVGGAVGHRQAHRAVADRRDLKALPSECPVLHDSLLGKKLEGNFWRTVVSVRCGGQSGAVDAGVLGDAPAEVAGGVEVCVVDGGGVVEALCAGAEVEAEAVVVLGAGCGGVPARQESRALALDAALETALTTGPPAAGTGVPLRDTETALLREWLQQLAG